MKKRDLAIIISQLNLVKLPSYSLEQYQTESELAAEILWYAFSSNDINGKIVADFGCGNGIFGIGALILGAKMVYFVDVDKKSILTAKENLKSIEEKFSKKFSCSFVQKRVNEFSKKVDTVIQNPPFGVQTPHADREFLLQSFKFAKKVYSIHKIESLQFLDRFAQENNAQSIFLKRIYFPLKKTQKYHKKRKYDVVVGLWK